MNDQLRLLDDNLQNAQAELQEMNSKYANLTEHYTVLTAEHGSLKQANEQLRQQNATLSNQNQQSQSNSHETNSRAQQYIQILEGKCKQLEQKQKQDTDALQTKLNQQVATTTQVQNQLKETIQKELDATKRAKESDIQLQKAQIELNHLVGKLKASDEKHVSLLEQHEQTLKQLQQLQDQFAVAKDALNSDKALEEARKIEKQIQSVIVKLVKTEEATEVPNDEVLTCRAH